MAPKTPQDTDSKFLSEIPPYCPPRGLSPSSPNGLSAIPQTFQASLGLRALKEPEILFQQCLQGCLLTYLSSLLKNHLPWGMGKRGSTVLSSTLAYVYLLPLKLVFKLTSQWSSLWPCI